MLCSRVEIQVLSWNFKWVPPALISPTSFTRILCRSRLKFRFISPLQLDLVVPIKSNKNRPNPKPLKSQSRSDISSPPPGTRSFRVSRLGGMRSSRLLARTVKLVNVLETSGPLVHLGRNDCLPIPRGRPALAADLVHRGGSRETNFPAVPGAPMGCGETSIAHETS